MLIKNSFISYIREKISLFRVNHHVIMREDIIITSKLSRYYEKRSRNNELLISLLREKTMVYHLVYMGFSETTSQAGGKNATLAQCYIWFLDPFVEK